MIQFLGGFASWREIPHYGQAPKPKESTLWRWLERVLRQGKILQDGTGTRADPYRYWLPGKEEEWKRDPIYELH